MSSREGVDPVRQIADAVLYEGYMLWPYRRSALKNQQRFTFGGVYPRGWPEDPSELRSECLLSDASEPRIEITVRFLQVVRRRLRDPAGRAVDELSVGERRHLAWDEAVEREVAIGEVPATVPIAIAAAEQEEALVRSYGEPAGAIVRSWRELGGAVEVDAERLGAALWRLRIRVANEAEWRGESRAETLERTFCSTHAILRAR